MADGQQGGTGPGRRGHLRVGTSGYLYDHWAGIFYPASLPKRSWFQHYAGEFDAVEINNTFYGLPGAETFDAWRDRAPRGFLYALKFSRYATHMKHLKAPEDTIGNFLEGARRLKAHLGPILVQLPPRWHVDVDRLRGFLESAPSDLRWAVEVRHRSWLCEDVFGVLRASGAALCIHDMLEDHPWVVTADWVYLRYHGDRYRGSYTHQKLAAEADRIAGHLSAGRDVFAFFNNDVGGHAVRNAVDLRRYVRRRCDGPDAARA